ncbi:MAG: hypothetical protein V2I38_07565 [Alcanivoracaceae bacterium]|nr:hypothetical protein [Alcanivoracaceae bacterium]
MAEGYEPADVYIGLRDRVLALSPGQTDHSGPVLAVLMETGYPTAAATLVAVADGTVSLYFSNGGGIIGSGEYPQVREVGLEMISEVASHLPKLVQTDSYPLPQQSYTRFYVVTASGILTQSVLEEDLANERHGLSPLFYAGHKLIAYIRAAEEHRQAEQDAAIGSSSGG